MTAFSFSHSSFTTIHSINKLAPSPLLKPSLQFQSLQFFRFKNHSRFAARYKFPNSGFPIDSSSQLSHDDNGAESDEEDDDDDDVAAEEYDSVSGEIGEDSEQDEDEEDDESAGESVIGESTGVSGRESRYEEFKWQRVERIRNEVREFGEEIIDVEELASVYNFRIDKFQVLPQFSL